MKDELIQKLLEWASNIGNLIEGELPTLLQEFAFLGLVNALLGGVIFVGCMILLYFLYQTLKMKPDNYVDDVRFYVTLIFVIVLILSLSPLLSFKQGIQQYISPRISFIKMLTGKDMVL